VSKSPDAALRTLGAETVPTLKTIDDAANKLNALTTKSSMPFRFPSLSNNGQVSITLKLAIGEIEICELLVGVIYGSSGLTMQLFANIVAGGNAKVCQRVLSTNAVASVVLRVVIAGVGIYPTIERGSNA
jgi:hypothetical protein